MVVLNNLVPSDCQSPLFVDYADRSLIEDRMFHQEIEIIPLNHSINDSYDFLPIKDDLNPHSLFPSTLSYALFSPSLVGFSVSPAVLRVTLRGVPPDFDIMSFSFLKSFGRILDGRVVSDLLTLYSPDGSSQLSQV